MKKTLVLLLLSLMAFGTTLRADYSNPCCYEQPCDTSASCCGTNCGMNFCRIGIAAAIIAGFIAVIATNSSDPHSHHTH